ncbi:MAG TPA: Wzy polymerase domain-containing protein [Burkholderiaceae bacterium]|nr:Wzy polymerase domain-containing protein [Burkholderiaceae bacterium]
MLVVMQRAVQRGVAFVAISVPLISAVNEPPSPTLLNQCASIGLVGLWIAMLGAQGMRPSARDIAGLLGVALGLVGGIVVSHARGLPPSLASNLWATSLALAMAVCAGNSAGRDASAVTWFVDFAWALCLAGVINAAIGCIQVLAPGVPDGDWMARSSIAGRSVGNLRQPNHLASLGLWALVAIVGLHELKAVRRAYAVVLMMVTLMGVVLSGSRTGLVGVFLLAGWGFFDGQLSRPARLALRGAPILFLGLWLAAAAWAHLSAQTFGGEGHLLSEGGDISSSRFAIWSNTLAMIAQEPLAGVGFGEFNIAWTLTAFPDRPVAFFDHTHNLVLQFLVELGIPLGSFTIALLCVALVVAWRKAWGSAGELGVAKRAAFMVVLMIGLHSLLEYPLWYAYFLLPTAFAWGFVLSSPPPSSVERGSWSAPNTRGSRTLAFAGLAMAIGAAAAVLDYWRVAVIYDPGDSSMPLEERIERGQRSPLFGHHADYAAATAFGEPKAPLSPSQQLAFRRAPHQLLDVRLMIAWAQALAAEGELDKARWLAARIREFRNPGSDEFFAPCQRAETAATAFQCQPPQRAVPWREFIQR